MLQNNNEKKSYIEIATLAKIDIQQFPTGVLKIYMLQRKLLQLLISLLEASKRELRKGMKNDV